MDQKSDAQQFSQIINPSGIDIDLFIKACQQQEIAPLTEFILSMQKILKLYDKPGRVNPFTALSSATMAMLLEKLRHLESRLKWTEYQLKVRKIGERLMAMGSMKVIPRTRQEQQQVKKLTSTINVEQVVANPQILNQKFSHPLHLYNFAINEILPQVGRNILSINDHQKRYQAVLKGLNLCSALIHPTEIEIQISKNTLLEARVFRMKYESGFQASQVGFLRKAANIVNQALLCPSDARVQGQLLKLLKRMYQLWGEPIHDPLFLNLKNISLFFNEQPSTVKMLKQASIFCYSIINSKSDIKFADMLQSSQDVADLRRNQHFSSKGLTLPFELGLSYDTVNLMLPIWRYRLHLDSRETYTHPILIQKSNTLLYYRFQIQSHDIGFGIYKVSLLKKYHIDQYDKNQECKAILKLARYGSGTANSKMPAKGQIFLKTGIYYLIFDNSHSMVRGKDLFVETCQLESIL